MNASPILPLGGAVAIAQLAACGHQLTGADILEDLRQQHVLLDDDGASPPAGRTQPPHPPRAPDPLERDTITIDDLLRAADLYNPRIAQARAAIGMAAGETWQASLYPNPSVELDAEEIPLSAGGLGRSKATIGVAQPIIVSNRRGAAVAGGRAEQRASGWDLQQRRRNVFGDVRRQLAEIAYLQEAARLDAQLLEVARRTLQIAQTRFDARAAPESEVIRAQVEADSLELSIQRLGRDLAAACERLNMLIGGREVPIDRLDATPAPNPAALDLPGLETLLAETHPRLLADEARIEAAAHRVDQAKAGRTPDIEARLAYGFDGEFDEHILAAGLSIPLALADRNQGNVLKARFALIAAREQAKADLNELRAELAAAYQRYMSAREQAAAFESRIVAAADKSLTQTRDGYLAGKLAFLDLLDAQRTLAQAQVARLNLVRDLNVARADLHAIVGPSLVLAPSPPLDGEPP